MPRKKSDIAQYSKSQRRSKRLRQLKKAVEYYENRLAQDGINYRTVVEHETHLAEVSNSKAHLPASETIEQREIRLSELRKCKAQILALETRKRTASETETQRNILTEAGKRAKRRASETPHQREKRLEADRQRKARLRASEPPERREIRLVVERKLKALQRKAKAEARQKYAETPEQREIRLNEFNESKAQLLAWKREALEHLALSKALQTRQVKRIAKTERLRLQYLPSSSKTPEQREARLEAIIERNKRLVASETPSQRKQRLEFCKKRIAEITASEKLERHEIRLKAIRNLKALKLEATLASQQDGALDTPEQREHFLKHFEERRAQLRNLKHEALRLAALSAAEQIHEVRLTETSIKDSVAERKREERQCCTITPETNLEVCLEYKQRLESLPGSSDTSQDPVGDSRNFISIEVNPLHKFKPAVKLGVLAAVRPSASAKMEAEEVIPDITIKNEIDIEEERLIKTEIPDYLNTPTHPDNTKACESTQITIKLEPDFESKDDTYLVERDDIVDKPRAVETFNAHNIPVNIKEENNESMVTYDYPNFDDGGSMDSSEAAALANVETCLQDDINIKTENGVHLEDSHKQEFISTELQMESETTMEQNSSIQIIPDIAEPPKYSFVMKIPADVISNIDQIVNSCLNNSVTGNVDYAAYLDRDTPIDDVDKKVNKESLNDTPESTSLLVESDKSEIIGDVPSVKNVQCPKCPKKFITKSRLKAHLKVHQTIENYRNGLKRGLETKRKNIFKRKQSSTHGSQDTCSNNQNMKVENKEGYKCTCGKTFQRKTRMESCLKSHYCEISQDSTNEKSSNYTTNKTSFLEESNESEMLDSNSFQLNSITGNFLSLEQEAYNMMKQKGNIQCPKCTNTFVSKYSLKKHLKIHNIISNYRNGWKKGVETRKNASKKVQSLLQQVDEHESQDSCSNHQDIKVKKEVDKEGYKCTCGKTFQRKTRMESCLRSHDCFESEKFYCMTCLKDFKSKDELALHRKRLHRKKFPCKFCPTDYATRKKLFKHLQIHQKVDQMEYRVIEEVVKEKKKLSCLLCSKFYEEISELKIHVMTEHKGPYSCPHCKNTFPKINDFGNHTKTYHPEVGGQKVLDVIEAFSRLTQEWKCEECGLQFLEADKLALHQVEEHNPELKSEQQFQCSDCRRVFISQKGLTSHRRIHHSIETSEQTKVEIPGILCLECRKMCKDMAALTSHMRFHSPDRKYPCKFCDFRFATQEKRKVHAEIHTGEMKYVCFICEYQCSSENRLKIHKKSLKHANMKEYLLTGKPLIEETTSKDNEGKEAKEGNSSKDVESDSSVSNSDGEEVSCDICGEKFPSESKMLEHKETHPFIEIPNADNQPTRIFFK